MLSLIKIMILIENVLSYVRLRQRKTISTQCVFLGGFWKAIKTFGNWWNFVVFVLLNLRIIFDIGLSLKPQHQITIQNINIIVDGHHIGLFWIIFKIIFGYSSFFYSLHPICGHRLTHLFISVLTKQRPVLHTICWLKSIFKKSLGHMTNFVGNPQGVILKGVTKKKTVI